jgi:hypothetical protein
LSGILKAWALDCNCNAAIRRSKKNIFLIAKIIL